MSIENRINKIGSFSREKIDSNYRAAIHKKFSEIEPNPEVIRQILFEDFFLPLDSRLTERLDFIHRGLRNTFLNREILTLSPLGVFGLDQYLTRTSPLKIAHVVSRPADIVADPTIQLAAEAYRRRQKDRNKDEINLGATCLCTRLQKYSDKRFKSVFEMFGTLDSNCTAPDDFESKKLANLTETFLELFKSLKIKERPRVVFGNLKIASNFLKEEDENLTLDKKRDILQNKIPKSFIGVLPAELLDEQSFIDFVNESKIFRETLAIRRAVEEVRNINADIDVMTQIDRVDGLGHYNGLCFSLDVGKTNIIDGGSVDWVSKLSSNRKERTVVSGLGTQLLADLVNLKQNKK